MPFRGRPYDEALADNDSAASLEKRATRLECQRVVMEKLLRKIRGELAKDPVIWAAELINEIDALLGDEANGDKDT